MSTTDETIDPATATIDLWFTQGQGDGLAQWSDKHQAYVWARLPDWYSQFPDIKEQVGDPIPKEWGVVPANALAMDVMNQENYWV